MKRFVYLLFSVLALCACGLAEDEQDDRNKRIYITFTDPAFEAYCLREFDLDGNGRISIYEAQRIPTIACPNLGIRSLSDISYFTRLRTLDCSGNLLTELDLRKCPELERVDCSHNEIGWLDVEGLRALTRLDCSRNRLPALELGTAVSLAWLDARANLFKVLNLSSCSRSLVADVAQNPSLAVVYALPEQDVRADGHTVIER